MIGWFRRIPVPWVQWLIGFSVLLGTAADARELVLPLEFGFAEVSRESASALGMDDQGRVTIERNECSRTRLSDLQVESAAPRAWVSVLFDADLATRLFGRCVGPKNARGRLYVLLEPQVSESRLGVDLRLISTELRRPDGSKGLLTRPARLLAENIVLPRMQDIRVDLRQPMQAVDELIRSFADDAAPLLADRSRLVRVTTAETGVQAEILLSLEDRATVQTPEEPLSIQELEQWTRVEDELDGFLTTAILALAAATDDRDLQIELLAALLDARIAIGRALAEDDDSLVDPIRDLFVSAWDRLRPAVSKLEQAGSSARFPSLRLTTFMAGADAIAALDALGPEYGIDISRDGVRRLARMLLAGDAPLSFTPLSFNLDPRLQSLVGTRLQSGAAVAVRPHWLDWLISPAVADTPPAPLDLDALVPRRDRLDAYLAYVRELLIRKSEERIQASARLDQQVAPLFRPMVLATAWKESCWRHYLTPDQPPKVIRSSIGAVGMMQINGRVWRGVYDVGLLERDIEYNMAAGIEILEHYLVHYALRRGEHEEPGGLDNLPRATYAAYNGGPRHLSRYRKPDTSTRLKAIDRSFWRHFEQVRTTGQPEIGTCYAGR